MNNKKNLMRAAALLLTASIAAGTCTACSSPSNEPVESDTAAESEIASETLDYDSLTDLEKRALIKDDLPERDYGGMQFRISTKSGFLYEIDIDEETGDICDDALYARNRTVEDRFNVEIVPVITNANDGDTHVQAVRQSIMANDDAFELAATYVYKTGSLVTDGYYLNWLNMPYTDLSQPWWMSGVNDKFRVGDAIYTTVGNMCVSLIKLTYGVFYNRTIGAGYDMNEEIFSAIQNGTWTIDYFMTLISDVYRDINGDGTRDDSDFYGFVAENLTNLDVYPFAFDIRITDRDADNIPVLSLNNEKTISAVEKINQLYWNNTGSYIPKSADTPLTMFRNGNALFTTTYLGNAFSTFRDMEDDYSILPYPKWDESQESYMTGAMDNYSVLGIPVTVSDAEMVSIITEALNIESYKNLFPTYFVSALQDKYARDEESIEMINILMDGCNFDFCFLFSSSLAGVPYLFRTLVSAKSNDFASRYAKIEAKAEEGLSKVLAAYEENAEQ